MKRKLENEIKSNQKNIDEIDKLVKDRTPVKKQGRYKFITK